MKSPPKPDVVDWGYSRMFANWVCWVRQNFPLAFEGLDEGDYVTWPGDEDFEVLGPARVTLVVVNPQRKSWYIEVRRRSIQRYFTHPSQLKVVGRRSRALNAA